MKVLIVSDTHRHNENYLKVVEKVKPIDMLVHCGDIEGSEYLIAESAGCPVQMVTGNNDFFPIFRGKRNLISGSTECG